MTLISASRCMPRILRECPPARPTSDSALIQARGHSAHRRHRGAVQLARHESGVELDSRFPWPRLRSGPNNVGPIAAHALRGLETRGIVAEVARFPDQVQERDLRSADLIIALNEAEHRPLLDELFPSWSGTVEYWQVASRIGGCWGTELQAREM